jgi:hypothetical protein
MKKIITLALIVLIISAVGVAQTASESGFIISLKNGSSVRGRTLARDESTGSLRLTMTESSAGSPKSYAIIAMDDAESIKASSAETESIIVKLLGGSELRCKEFGLGGETITIKLGTASRVEVRWDQIESISFRQ